MKITRAACEVCHRIFTPHGLAIHVGRVHKAALAKAQVAQHDAEEAATRAR